MARVEIKYNPHQMARINRLLEAYPKQKGKVLSRGINKTALSARGKIVKELHDKTKLQQKAIRGSIRYFKATTTWWSALLRLSGKGISILRFKARQTKKGVTYTEPATGSQILIAHAFIATMPQGGAGVFTRVGKERLPIEKHYGPGLSEIYTKAPDVVNRIQRQTGKDLTKNVMAQVRLVLAQARAS
jgi:hypothetical protein